MSGPYRRDHPPMYLDLEPGAVVIVIEPEHESMFGYTPKRFHMATVRQRIESKAYASWVGYRVRFLPGERPSEPYGPQEMGCDASYVYGLVVGGAVPLLAAGEETAKATVGKMA